ncbi:class I SAM-dependent methyltransferase [Silvimonas amylolytica]|uniref:S-adenosyl-L-methionine-dependent methyltransferase n=1 Tax=Silvimonas amylolytica TaxID=449663 RepID=A0ABQ2PQL6_9NEIS|nr:class I SAM-dependent methyltransferase [Silvimonas amylolytica]GGP27927.1 S-adenosyl-L-methionine-dependent methyltransferase [Silvimonas amylolytica]
MTAPATLAPDATAVRTALWRALHLEVDAAPAVLHDDVGLKLAAPEEGWRERPDMHAQRTAPFRASIIARARFIEDCVIDGIKDGLARQYVLLGAGLDSFALRRPDIAAQMNIFEVDQPGHQAWKQARLAELDMTPPPSVHFVPVDFEAGDDWLKRLCKAGFSTGGPAIVTSTGVSMYLTHEAVVAMLRQVASLAKGSQFVMTFLLPIEMADEPLQPILRMGEAGAAASGTPFISYFKPQDMVELALQAGFSEVKHVSADDLAGLYFADRTDGLRPPARCEELIVATV